MIDNWFPTTIWYTDNNLVDDLDELKSRCFQIIAEISQDKHPFSESSLKTSFWHLKYGHIHLLPEFENLTSVILNQAVSFLNILGFPGIIEQELKFTNMWINLIEKNDYHAQHIHNSIGNSLISGVFYVDAPNNATLDFTSPYVDSYSPVKPIIDNDLNYSVVKYSCLPGRIVMFRSNVYHGYDSHGQEKNKISIPFNLAVKADRSNDNLRQLC